MNKLSAIALLLALSAPAFAETTTAATTPPPATEKSAYVCWYGTDGNLTGTQPWTKGVPRNFVVTGRGGDKTWASGVYSIDGKDCPAKVRK